MEKPSISVTFLFSFSLLLFSCGVNADETERFVYQAQNPLTPIYSIPLEYTHHGGAKNGDVSIGSVKPVIPIALGDWNLINQLSLNFIGTPGPVNGIAELPEAFPGDGAYGLGDTTLTSYFSLNTSDDFSWGFGPTLVFPTDTLFGDTEDRESRELGSGKFSVGPAVMFVTQPKPWSLGLAVKQIWSVFGNDSRDGVSQMLFQPFVNYNLNDGWYLVSDMDMIANWNRDNDDRWTVPVGGGVGKLFSLGQYAINTKVEGYYNPVRVSESPEWSANFSFQFLFGK
ncbi:hypothetical protein GO003_020000 [Methylicorpusculum oleiharenae]|uniref:neuromedin U n=1 Tax=Methylicorpusculum oleiharenae TaxID=1338687 RepID=UPI00135A696F|nr:neuromedin U [Methylicorpusculum oleiharenae]MCD2452670.1 hypothetical protein [Methylicorpusculum oleiharenae]